MTTEAPAQTDGQVSDGQAAPPAEGEQKAEKSKRALNGVYVTTSKELREKLEAEATLKEESVAGFVRNLLAERYGIVIAPTPARTKYDTPEQKKEAQKQARKSRADLIKQLLAEHKAKQSGTEAAAPAEAPAA